MSLRRKLAVTFGGLGLIVLLVSAVTVWSMVQWRTTEDTLREHYERSLLLQEVRGQTFQAFLEVPEGLTGNDPDARQDFQETIAPADDAFGRWADLADTPEERQEVERVRTSYDEVVDGAGRAFDLLEDENFQEAETAFDELEDSTLEEFQAAAQDAATADEERRTEIREGTQDTRRTAQIMLAISSFGALSLVLMIAGYLASDIFNPLKDVRQALSSVRRGDRQVRLPEERSDEVGEINQEFNAMVAALARRDRSQSATNAGAMGTAGTTLENGSTNADSHESDWTETSSKVALHAAVSEMRSRVRALERDAGNGRAHELVEQLDRLSQTVSRITSFGYPLDLSLERSAVRELLYEAMQRFQRDLARRAVSVEVEVSAEVSYARLDRLKLLEALSEMMRNSLAALPERGGRIGLRAREEHSAEGEELLLEVADDGIGAEQSLIDEVFERSARNRDGGLALVRAVAEQHGGRLEVTTEPGEGTYASIRIPLIER